MAFSEMTYDKSVWKIDFRDLNSNFQPYSVKCLNRPDGEGS